MPSTRRGFLGRVGAIPPLVLAGCSGPSEDGDASTDPAASEPSSLTESTPALTIEITNAGESSIAVECRFAPLETSAGTRIARSATLSAGDRLTVDVDDPAESRLTVDDRTHDTSRTTEIRLDAIREHGPNAVYAVSIDDAGAMTTGFE